MTVSCNIRNCLLNDSGLCMQEFITIRNGTCYNLIDINNAPRDFVNNPRYTKKDGAQIIDAIPPEEETEKATE